MIEKQLRPALDGRSEIVDTPSGPVSVYVSRATAGAPLLLVHSVNAAGSAYEVKPLFDHYGDRRRVYAMELPGFGRSDRSDRVYSVRLMVDAIKAVTQHIRSECPGEPIDALAVSLGCEFLARAISEQPDFYRSAALVSATGFDRKGPYLAPEGTTRAMPALYGFFRFPLWDKALYAGLTSRPSIRYFLAKTWGSKTIDEGLLDYDYETAHQPGARFAPYYFVSGYLFSRDITRVYESLTLPCWLAHGNRGDFQDYSGATRIADRSNWTVTSFDTGALPHFEKLSAFTAQYDAFLAKVPV